MFHYGKRNAGSLTAASPGDTLYIPFAIYNDSGASIVDTGFNQADIEIYKNNNPVARATDSGVWLGDSGVNYYVAGARVAASALSDTGLYGDVSGLYTIGIRLFNTTDDTGFFDAGSTYHVTVQGLSILGQTGHYKEVNFIAGVFEIDGVRVQAGVQQQAGNQGALEADIVSAHGDTGAIHILSGHLAATDSGVVAAVVDTGKIGTAVWTNTTTRTATSVSGSVGSVTGAVGSVTGAVGSVTGNVGGNVVGSVASVTGNVGGNVVGSVGSVTGNIGGTVVSVTNKLDTGVPASVRVAMDTGTFNTVPTSGTITTVTGNVNGSVASVTGNVGGNVVGSVGSVTGSVGSVTLVSANAIDTGSFTGTAAKANDTGALEASISTGVWANTTRTLSSFQFDTGIWASNASRTIATVTGNVNGSVGSVTGSVGGNVTGSVGSVAGNVDGNVTGNIGGSVLSVTNKLDTGVPLSVWVSTTRSLTTFGFDTGIAQTVWRESTSTYTADTGSVAYAQGRLMAVRTDTGAAHLDAGRLGVSAPAAALDTGATKDAVWGTAPGTSTRYLTGSQNIDTGVANQVWKESSSTYTADTGSVGYAQGRLLAVKGDTGAAHLDGGRLGVSAPAAVVDTGTINNAVWQTASGDNTRALTTFAFDTGIAQTVWRSSNSTFTDTGSLGYGINVHKFRGDTGPGNRLAQFANLLSGGLISVNTIAANSFTAAKFASGAFDTGTFTGTAAKANDTGALEASISAGVWSNATRTVDSVSGAVGSVSGAVGSVTGDVGGNLVGNVGGTVVSVTNKLDTGVPLSVWASTSRTLTSFAFDTGVTATVWRASLSAYTDTGSAGYKLDLVDTGIRSAIADVRADITAHDASIDTQLAVITAKVDTGVTATVDLTPVTNKLDTGVPLSVWASATRSLTTFSFDTGITATVWRASTSAYTDTGSAGYKLDLIDTGIKGHIDDARILVTNKLDTGVPASIDQTDTGLRDVILTKLDTGVPLSVWASATRSLTTFAFDTGIAQTVWRSSGSTFTDTGSLGYKLDLLDTGVRSKLDDIDTGTTINLNRILAKVDTGVTVTVDLTAVTNKLDTGVPASVRVALDTGTLNSVGTVDLTAVTAKLDTGVPASVKALADTGYFGANILAVNSVVVQGTGDTGLNDPWRPV